MSWVNCLQDAHTNASEVLKGMATAAGTLSGGWGFNMWEYDDVEQEWVPVRYSPAGVVAAIADGSITNKPAFGVSDAEEMVIQTRRKTMYSLRSPSTCRRCRIRWAGRMC